MSLDKLAVNKKRADCRIWAHLLYWNIIPLGWIISTFNIRSWIPVYIMLGAMVISGITSPKTSGISPKEAFRKGIAHGQRIGVLANIIGSVVTINLIMNARQEIATSQSGSQTSENDED